MQESNKIIQAFNILRNTEEVSLIRSALVKIFIENNINYKEFSEDLANDYINELLAISHNKSLVMAKTGLSYRLIDKALKNEGKAKYRAKSLLEESIYELSEYFNLHKSEKMPLKLFNERMAAYYDGKSSVKEKLNNLFDSGIIKKQDGYVYLALEKSIKKRSEADILKIIGNEFDRLVDTISYNQNKFGKLIDTIDNNQNGNETMFQLTVGSTQIPPEKSELLKTEINSILRRCYKQVFDLLVEHEEDVKVGTYPRIGASSYHYNENYNNTQEKNHENNE